MAYDKFLIADFDVGLETDLKPWRIPDQAFTFLENAYVFRGRVKKRFGSQLMGPTQLNSRLRVLVGVITAGSLSGTVPGDVFEVGQSFSAGSIIFTVYNPAAGANQMLRTDQSVSAATYNVGTGAFNITGTGLPNATPVYFYLSQPVMGITQYENAAINNLPSYAFDTKFAYLFAGNGWDRSGTAEWHGDDTNFFWVCNWKGITQNLNAMFVTNFQVTNPNGASVATDDPIWDTQDGTNWEIYYPYFLPAGGAPEAGPFVQTSRIIVAFKNRLLLLNTIENDNSGGTNSGINTWYPQRCRYSFNGSPFAVNAWYEPNQSDNAGMDDSNAAGAGYIDATTDEQIISAQFIKDRLIVFFERSTWELAYTGNEILPFVWQKINQELGSQSTFSTVPFDKVILTIGNTGIHGCTGTNVERIDNKIPDEIFEFVTKNNATTRTAGIRDYFTELVYWSFLSDQRTTTQTFPNQILVYNYKNGSWALNDDTFTAFGYFEQSSDTTWLSSFPTTWLQFNNTWDSGVLQANLRQILAGTPEGFILILNPGLSRNAASLQITNMVFSANGIITLTIISHNLTLEDYILFESIVADPLTQGVLNGSIYRVNSIVNGNTITINTNGVLTAGTYYGGGTAARVSNIQIYSKQFNPYVDKDRNVFLAKIDFGVQKTTYGQITVDYYPSSTELSMIQEGEATGSIMGNNILETSPYSATFAPLEAFQERLWHPIYFQSSGECIQLAMYLSPAQMINPFISLEDFELEGMILYTQPTSQRLE